MAAHPPRAGVVRRGHPGALAGPCNLSGLLRKISSLRTICTSRRQAFAWRSAPFSLAARGEETKDRGVPAVVVIVFYSAVSFSYCDAFRRAFTVAQTVLRQFRMRLRFPPGSRVF